MDILKIPALLLVAAAIAYLLGWAYLDAYYDTFEVAISNLRLPLEHYFAIGVVSLLRGAIFLNDYQSDRIILICRVVIWASVVLSLLALLPIRWFERFRTPFIAALMLAATGGAYELTRRVAEENAVIDPPPVELRLTATPAPEGQSSDNVFTDVRLIYWDETRVVVGAWDCPDMYRRSAATAEPTTGDKPAPAAAEGLASASEEISLPEFERQLRRVRWRVWVLPADRVDSVNFDKIISRTRSDMLRDTYNACLETVPQAPRSDEDKPTPTRDEASAP